jgi:hypothetical protein
MITVPVGTSFYEVIYATDTHPIGGQARVLSAVTGTCHIGACPVALALAATTLALALIWSSTQQVTIPGTVVVVTVAELARVTLAGVSTYRVAVTHTTHAVAIATAHQARVVSARKHSTLQPFVLGTKNLVTNIKKTTPMHSIL